MYFGLPFSEFQYWVVIFRLLFILFFSSVGDISLAWPLFHCSTHEPSICDGLDWNSFNYFGFSLGVMFCQFKSCVMLNINSPSLFIIHSSWPHVWFVVLTGRSVSLAVVVEKSRKCLDFGSTIYILHLLFCTLTRVSSICLFCVCLVFPLMVTWNFLCPTLGLS